MKINGQCIAIIDLQYGDGGKGKITDAIADQFSTVVRFNGGPNAGHTIYNNGKEYKLHQIPSGVFNPGTTLIIGPECLVDLRKLKKEISDLKEGGIDPLIYLDGDATLISSMNILKDQEKKDVKDSIGTTGCGIGPASASRCMRESLRVKDCVPGIGKKTVEAEENLKILKEIHDNVEVWNTTVKLVHQTLDDGERILFEGAQGIGLDLIHGEYPNVSQRCMPANILTSYGMHRSLRDINVVGIMKPYLTRSGAGWMRSEMKPEDADVIRKRGNEFGATTGRPRRCAWLNIEPLDKAIRLSGCNEIVLTKLDILANSDEIPTCKHDGGIPFHTYDSKTEYISREILPPFNDIKDSGSFVRKLQEHLAAPIKWVSYGPNRGQEVAWRDADFQW